MASISTSRDSGAGASEPARRWMNMSYQRFNRRRFLIASTALAASAVVPRPLWLAAAEIAAPDHRYLSLNGAWEFCRSDAAEWLPATVPGCVHTDLLAAGKIPDPFFRDNERSLQWIGESVWIYRRTFDVPADLLQHDRVLLRCDGLDTLATVTINGTEIGRPDNMFRTWEFEAKTALRAGENVIE